MAPTNRRSSPPDAGSGEFLVPRKGSHSGYKFRSHDSLCSFLGISEPYNTCQAHAPHARKNPPHCSRNINRNKRKTVLDLLASLCQATVPSQSAATLLEKLSPHVVCGQTSLHQYQAPIVYKKWCTKLWADYLRANGLGPQLYMYSDQTPALSLRTWEDALDRAREKPRASSHHCDDASSVYDSNEEDSEDSEDSEDDEDDDDEDDEDDGDSRYTTPETTTSDLSIATSNFSEEETTDYAAAARLLQDILQDLLQDLLRQNSATRSQLELLQEQQQPRQQQQQPRQQQPQPRQQQPQQQQQRAFVVYRDPEPARLAPTTVVSTSSGHAQAGNRQALGALDRNQPSLSARNRNQAPLLSRSSGESTSAASSLFTAPLASRRSTELAQADAKVAATRSPPPAELPFASEEEHIAAPSHEALGSLHELEGGNDHGHSVVQDRGENETKTREILEWDDGQAERDGEAQTQDASSNPSDLAASESGDVGHAGLAGQVGSGEEEPMAVAASDVRYDVGGQGQASVTSSGSGREVEQRDKADGDGKSEEEINDSGEEDGVHAGERETKDSSGPSLPDDTVIAKLESSSSIISVASGALVDSLATPPCLALALVAATSSIPPSLPPPGRHPTFFRPYAPPMDPLVLLKKLLDKMVQPVCHEHRRRGFIYGYVRPSLPGFVKIGHVRDVANNNNNNNTNRNRQRKKQPHRADPVDYRLACWEADCRQPVVKVFQVEITCPAVERIERLVHLTLQDRRRVQTPPCEPCRQRSKHGTGGHHKEWFEMDVDAVRHVVEMWAQVASQPAYDSLGRLVQFWWTQADRDLLRLDAYGSALGWLATVPDLVAEYRRQVLASMPGPDL